MPLIKKIKGRETIDSISKKIEKDVQVRLSRDFKKMGIDTFPREIILVGLKEEQILEVYVKVHQVFKLLKSYRFTAFSGSLGPKLKEGDKQIPEGIYQIEYINPNSAYYLALKINYPNEMDRQKSSFANVADLGSDIFIHGKAVSIGCIAIGDRAIEEVFILSKHASQTGIKVIISPRDFRKNPTYPVIDEISWETKLYDEIKTELDKITTF
jgi:murein L,D-transpeptidase YafK